MVNYIKIIDFIEMTELVSKSETEKAKLLCYYHLKESGEMNFAMSLISRLFEEFGFSKPNTSRLKDKLSKGKGKVMLSSKKVNNDLEFVPVVFQVLEQEFSKAWNDTETIESSSELLDETKFCGKRPFMDKLIQQINFTYAKNCYDACAVLMRRLFEVLLVLVYQYNNIEAEITNTKGDHFMLEGIVKNAVQNKTLNIPSRICKNFDAFREVGNNSAHSITYTAGKKDIDDIKRDYRVMMEDLYNKSGLI